MARIVLLSIIIGLPLAAYVYETEFRDAHAEGRVIGITARVPEDGGFTPANIRIATGETVTLRFASTDVTHGIAIGPGWDLNVGHVDPGMVKELTLSFDEPGTYTYYCTTWCSKDHWRMRGVFTVYDPAEPKYVPPPRIDPVMTNLVEEGVNIDALHTGQTEHTTEIVFEREPSEVNGEALAASLDLPTDVLDQAWRRTHTPREALSQLEMAFPGMAQADLIDVVLYLWTSAEPSATAEAYYNSNCAACHGQQGNGDGPAATTTAEDPAAFGDLQYMFDMRADVLYAKLRRGGMGTDMPNFGTLLTPEESWLIVEYLWTLPTRAVEPPA